MTDTFNPQAMPQPPGGVDPMNDHPDFTDRTNVQNRWFTIDDDTFYCARVIPAGIGRLLASLQSMEPVQQYESIGTMLDMVMLPESAEKFAARMLDPEKPISIEQVDQVLRWMMKVYGGGRPTTPSSSSQPLPIGNGTSSMDGVLPEASTV